MIQLIYILTCFFSYTNHAVRVDNENDTIESHSQNGDEREGIWSVIPNGEWEFHTVFRYTDSTVTLHYVGPSDHDNWFRLASRWKSDTLQIQACNGSWDNWAVFQDNHFWLLHAGSLMACERIDADQLSESQKPVLFNREICKEPRK